MSEPRPPPPPPATVMVVDDVAAGRYVTCRVLAGAGYRVVEADCGAACLHAALAAPPDAIVLDVGLPDIDGFEVARRLRAAPATAQVALLHLSAAAVSSASRAFGLLQAADSYLVQPVDPHVLIASLAALLRMRRAERVAAAMALREREARDRAEAATAQIHALNDELRAALRARDDFLSMVSHEIKTPVTAVQVLIEVLRRRLRRGDTATLLAILGARLETISGQTARLVSMVDALLDLGGLSAGGVVLSCAPVDLALLCREVVARPLGEGAPTLTLEVPTEPVIGHWDRVRIDQILTNLIANACKYGGPSLRISVVRRAETAVLAVADDGPGIAAADRERIFGRFERLPGARGRSGFGVGLWIVQRVAVALGGEIALTNPGGPGCCFEVRLPLAGPRAAGGTAPAGSAG